MCNSSSILRCTLIPDYSVQLSLIAVTIGVTNTLIVLQENHGITIMAVMYISAQWSFSDDSLELMLVYSLTRPSSELFCHVTFFATFMAF